MRQAFLLQATVTFILGVILTISGLPSDEADATLLVGEKTMENIQETSNSPEVKNIANKGDEVMTLMGKLLMIGSAFEFLLVLTSYFRM